MLYQSIVNRENHTAHRCVALRFSNKQKIYGSLCPVDPAAVLILNVYREAK